MAKKLSKTAEDLLQRVGELTEDLQRTRADFENYRKHAEEDIERAGKNGEKKAVMKILPILDVLDKATATIPEDLRENAWAQGIAALQKSVAKTAADLKLSKIDAHVGDEFNHDLHHAIQFDEDSAGAREVIAEILQPGYLYDGAVLRPVLVKVKRAD
jgi:molecular chaperone GrpE